jgi:hypothetical protein
LGIFKTNQGTDWRYTKTYKANINFPESFFSAKFSHLPNAKNAFLSNMKKMRTHTNPFILDKKTNCEMILFRGDNIV